VPWCGAEPPESTWFDQGAAMRQARDHIIYDYCRDPSVEDRFKEECSSHY
jgi:hypothetical protein